MGGPSLRKLFQICQRPSLNRKRRSPLILFRECVCEKCNCSNYFKTLFQMP